MRSGEAYDTNKQLTNGDTNRHFQSTTVEQQSRKKYRNGTARATRPTSLMAKHTRAVNGSILSGATTITILKKSVRDIK